MPVAAIVANTSWNIWNYRLSLIRALHARGWEVICIAPYDRHVDKLLAEPGVRFVPLKRLDRKSLSPFKNTALFWELVRIFRREKPDITFLFTIKPNLLGNFAGALSRSKTISTIEGLGAAGTVSAKYKKWALFLYRQAFRFAEKTIFLNRDDLHDFIRHRAIRPEQSILVPGPGVDTTHFSPVKNEPHPIPVFLFMGRFLEEKGVFEYAKAALAVKKAGFSARFQLLGSIDPDNPSSLNTAELQAIIDQGAVEYLGRTDDVRDILAQTDILVLPSYYREGVPRSVLEAMAMEKLVITTDNAGCRDTVDIGKNGFLVPPKNAEALAEAFQKMIGLSGEKRHEMGRYSRQMVVSKFSDAVVLPLMLDPIIGRSNR